MNTDMNSEESVEFKLQLPISRRISGVVDIPISFSSSAVEGLRSRIGASNFELFDASNFQLDVADITLLDQLAKGSYGIVYRCSLKGKIHAVKVEDFLPGTEEQINLLVELSILHSLPHERLVSFFGGGHVSKASTGASKIMIIMELCSHGALREGLRYPLPWALRVRLAMETAEGLAFLHENRIIHRDVKTTNVLITDDWRAKLCDFSFACHADYDNKTAFVYGTDEFMSPEIAMGDNFDVSADIFSFGILLCEVATGREPSIDFLHRQAKTLFALDEDELKDSLPEDCPESLEALILQCCSTDPSNRPTAQECVEWLQGLLDDLGGPDIKLDTPELATANEIIEREGNVKYPKTHGLSAIRHSVGGGGDGSDSASRLAFLEVQVQELRAENRRLSREMSSLLTQQKQQLRHAIALSPHVTNRRHTTFLPEPSPKSKNRKGAKRQNLLHELSTDFEEDSSPPISALVSEVSSRLAILENRVTELDAKRGQTGGDLGSMSADTPREGQLTDLRTKLGELSAAVEVLQIASKNGQLVSSRSEKDAPGTSVAAPPVEEAMRDHLHSFSVLLSSLGRKEGKAAVSSELSSALESFLSAVKEADTGLRSPVRVKNPNLRLSVGEGDWRSTWHEVVSPSTPKTVSPEFTAIAGNVPPQMTSLQE